MAERTVKLGSMFYIDEDGRARRGEFDEKIKVHPDFVKKFDDLNVLADDVDTFAVEAVPPVAPEAVEAEKREVPEPPRRGRPRKESDD